MWRAFLPLKIYCRSISGQHNIPAGPCIAVSIHEGPLDSSFIMLALKRDMRYIAARHLLQTTGPTGWYHRRILFPIGRAIPTGEHCIETCLAALASGQTVGIFPEGDIWPALHQPRIHTGAVVLSHLTQLPILPVHIKNSGRVWPIFPLWKIAFWRTRSVRLSIGRVIPALPSGQTYSRTEYQEASDRVMETILSL